MIILLPCGASADRALSLETRKRTISGNHHDTIESSDHFCEFLLQNGLKAGEETTSGSEFKTNTSAACRIGDDIASTGKLGGTHQRPIDLMMGSIPVVERD